MVFSGSQWFLGSYKQKGWNRNKATTGESIYACRPMDGLLQTKNSPFSIRNHWEPVGNTEKQRKQMTWFELLTVAANDRQ